VIEHLIEVPGCLLEVEVEYADTKTQLKDKIFAQLAIYPIMNSD